MSFEYHCIWPLPGLISDDLPIELDPALQIAAVTDTEMIDCLNTDLIRPTFPQMAIFQDTLDQRTRLHYSYRLDKIIGEADNIARTHETPNLHEHLERIQDYFKETLSLALHRRILLPGRLSRKAMWNPFFEGTIW